jgi:hypothetical protein
MANTNLPRQHASGLVVPDVVHDGQWWQYVPVTSKIDLCRRFVVGLRNRRSGAVFTWPKPCDDFYCWDCAERRVTRELEHAAHRFGALDSLFFSMVAHPDHQVRKRLNARSSRAHADYVLVRRAHVALVFSSAPLGARELPSTSAVITPQQGLCLLASPALRLPGIPRAPSWSHGWNSPSTCPTCGPSRGLHKGYGLHRKADFDAAFNRAADAMDRQYGVRPEIGWPMPEAVPVDEWDALLEAELLVAGSPSN